MALARKSDSPPESVIMGDAGHDLVVVHFCGYGGRPTEVDRQTMLDEIGTDPRFGLVGFEGEIQITDAPQILIDHFQTLWDDQDPQEGPKTPTQ